MGAAQSALESATAAVHTPASHPHSLRPPIRFVHSPCLTGVSAVCLVRLSLFLLCRPCIRCIKPFTPSAADLHEAAGYQPVATQPHQSHTAPQPHTAAPSAATAASDSELHSADDNTDWEEFEDFDQEQDRIEKGQTATQQHTADTTTPPASATPPSASSLTSPTHASSTTRPKPLPSLSPPRPQPTVPRPSPPPAIDFFGSVGIASSGYQEPVRLATKAKAQSAAAVVSMSPVLSASQRADVMREYGLDDVGVEVGSWDDGLELDIEGEGGSGNGAGRQGDGKGRKGGKGGASEKKKKGLGAVAVMDDEV